MIVLCRHRRHKYMRPVRHISSNRYNQLASMVWCNSGSNRSSNSISRMCSICSRYNHWTYSSNSLHNSRRHTKISRCGILIVVNVWSWHWFISISIYINSCNFWCWDCSQVILLWVAQKSSRTGHQFGESMGGVCYRNLSHLFNHTITRWCIAAYRRWAIDTNQYNWTILIVKCFWSVFSMPLGPARFDDNTFKLKSRMWIISRRRSTLNCWGISYVETQPNCSLRIQCRICSHIKINSR